MAAFEILQDRVDQAEAKGEENASRLAPLVAPPDTPEPQPEPQPEPEPEQPQPKPEPQLEPESEPDMDCADALTLSKGHTIQSLDQVTEVILNDCRVNDMHAICARFNIEVPQRTKKAGLRALILTAAQA